MTSKSKLWALFIQLWECLGIFSVSTVLYPSIGHGSLKNPDAHSSVVDADTPVIPASRSAAIINPLPNIFIPLFLHKCDIVLSYPTIYLSYAIIYYKIDKKRFFYPPRYRRLTSSSPRSFEASPSRDIVPFSSTYP